MSYRITLQRQATTRDEVGQKANTWTRLGDAFCSIEPISGREFLATSGEQATVTHKVRMRARDDFTLRPDDRVLYGTRVFDITAVLDEMEQGRIWTLMVIESRQTLG